MRQHGSAFDGIPACSPAGPAGLAVDQYEVMDLRRKEIREPANATVGLPERALERAARLPLPPEADVSPSLGELLGDVPLMHVIYCFPLLKARHGCSVARSEEQVPDHGLNLASPIQSQ
ncbi:hypothetical protein [Streptomyces sp. NPDC002853]